MHDIDFTDPSTYRIPINQFNKSQLETVIKVFSNVMLEQDKSYNPTGIDLDQYFVGSRIVFLRNLELNPNASIFDIIGMCLAEARAHNTSVDHLNNCFDLPDSDK